MSDKQRLLEAVTGLPESADVSQLTDAVLNFLANRGAMAEFARVYRAQMTADDLAEHLDPKLDYELGAVIAEIKARHAKGGAA